MGTWIEAIIFDGDPDAAAVPAGLGTVLLGAGQRMLTVTSAAPAAVDSDAVGDEPIPAAWMPKQPVAELAKAPSADRPVLYIITQPAGGPGTKEAIG